MLSQEQIQNNKEEFLALINSMKAIEGARIDKLIHKLENSDFFYAPASTQYHCSYEGGLCEHSLNVYRVLKNLFSSVVSEAEAPGYTENDIRIVALFHDICKMNVYEQSIKNEKVYCNDGNKEDGLGKFRWISKPVWKRKDYAFNFGSQEMTSEYIISQYIPLTLDQSVAILHSSGGMSDDSAKDDIPKIFNYYPLALLLHTADLIATYIAEAETY